MRRPYFRDKGVALGVGVAGLALAWFALSDAYERRGGDQPRLLKVITWW